MTKIYTASSWKNKAYPEVVNLLQSLKYEVYDFRNAISTDGNKTAFNWEQIDQKWEDWDTNTFLNQITTNKLAINAFNSDLNGMLEADIGLLITPSGNSSHIEAGFMVGLGKPLYIYMSEHHQRPDLTYSLACKIFTTFKEMELFFREKME